jgi:hypothetical protein
MGAMLQPSSGEDDEMPYSDELMTGGLPFELDTMLPGKPRDGAKEPGQSAGSAARLVSSATSTPVGPTQATSRIGRKAISAYFSPEMSLARHVCARKHGLSLQAFMAEAFDDVLRKDGESPIGG